MIRAFLPKVVQRLPAWPTVSDSMKKQALLVVVAASAVAVTYSFVGSVPVSGEDPALLRLLRGMVILKGIIGTAALATIFWRLGRPVQVSDWAGYMLAALLIPVAVTWLWSLHMIPVGSLLFYSGLAILVGSAWRDQQFRPWRS